MKYKLINKPNIIFNPIQQFLFNRGIQPKDMVHYINTTDDDINEPELLGAPQLLEAVHILSDAIMNDIKTLIIVDSDCDGFSSSALLYNYLYHFFPQFVKSNLKYYLHNGKQHGLADCMDYIRQNQFKLIIVPDAGSNDAQECKQIKQDGGAVIILDHHEMDVANPYATIMNSQSPNYPNKELSGVGVVWQFCRFIDKYTYNDFVNNNYLDLVMLGMVGDMMSLRSYETKHLIRKGMLKIQNPFIRAMFTKNAYSLGANPTSYDVAFYVVPFINAICRSGTLEQKQITFKSMLERFAYESVPSTKRGHKLGDTELVVEQALRIVTNVKSRQTKAQDNAMIVLEKMIEQQNLLDNKVLLILLQQGTLDKNIAGLCANKLMAEYMRPVCILTRNGENYEGSARGCERAGILDFKSICHQTGAMNWQQGHANAFGCSINAARIDDFIEKTNETLRDMSDESIYFVDEIYLPSQLNSDDIISFANCAELYGKDMDECLIAVEGLKVSKDNIKLLGVSKGKPTLKIQTPQVSFIKFKSSQEEYDKLQQSAQVQMNIVGKCGINDYGGQRTAQILITDYEPIARKKWVF